MFPRRRRSPLLVLGMVGCALIAIATALYVASTQYWSGQKVADLDIRSGSASVALEPAMSPVRVILHRAGRRLHRSERAQVEVTLRDASGAALWSEHKSWRGRSSNGKSRGSGTSASVLHTFDVPAAGEYRFESVIDVPGDFVPRELRLEVRRHVARVNSTIVWTGVIGAAVTLLAGVLGARLTDG